MTTPDLMTTAQAAELLDRPVRTVQYWAATGRLVPALKAPGVNGVQFFDRAAVEALAEAEKARA